MVDSPGLLLTGRPASRTASRMTNPRLWNRDSEIEKDESDDDLNASLSSQLITGYETLAVSDVFHGNTGYETTNVSDVFHGNKHPAKKTDTTNSRLKIVSNDSLKPIGSTYTLQYPMSKTRNKYRIKRRAPTHCDETLFGRTSTTYDKEWKAPWDNSKSSRPLVFDSTDRMGFYSADKPKSASSQDKASSRRAWR